MSVEGDRLKARRESRGWTQEQLAERSGVTRDKVAKIETGVRRMTATDAAYLAQAMGMRAHDLVARPRHEVRFRESGQLSTQAREEVAEVGAWFAGFVQNALHLEDRAKRYGLE